MKRNKTLTAAMIFGFISLSAGMVIANNLPTRGPVDFATWDADGNGTIEEQEFNTVRQQRQTAAKANGRLGRNMVNAPSFAQIDTDNDGKISAKELTVMQQGQRGKSIRGRGHHGAGPGIRANMMGPRYLAMDDETRAKYDAFFADTTELRKEIAAKRTEKRAIMHTTNPDPDQAAQLTRELLQLRSQMMTKADKAGIDIGPGSGFRHGYDGKGHGCARW